MPYIEREKVAEMIKNYGKNAIDDGLKTLDPIDDIVLLAKFVDSIPTADVVEVKYGEWIGIADFGNGNCIGYCSACGTTQKAENPTDLKMFHKYCRWCGAKMY